jgi:hypothetical protein
VGYLRILLALSVAEDMQSAGLAKVEGESLVLTPKGQRVARLFTWLQEFARVAPATSEAA